MNEENEGARMAADILRLVKEREQEGGDINSITAGLVYAVAAVGLRSLQVEELVNLCRHGCEQFLADYCTFLQRGKQDDELN